MIKELRAISPSHNHCSGVSPAPPIMASERCPKQYNTETQMMMRYLPVNASEMIAPKIGKKYTQDEKVW